MFVMPSTKQMASRMLDLPLPLSPVMELKLSSLQSASARARRLCGVVALESDYHPDITVRTAYDLKPCLGDQLRPGGKRQSVRTYVDNQFRHPHGGVVAKSVPFLLLGVGLGRRSQNQFPRHQLFVYFPRGCRVPQHAGTCASANWLVT